MWEGRKGGRGKGGGGKGETNKGIAGAVGTVVP